ncbi:hypothetical protein ZWY2020_005608 [Hordeum vulgare]|nr:hypothetical protein ZWY2020_005608 [Hordeum vulgare]
MEPRCRQRSGEAAEVALDGALALRNHERFTLRLPRHVREQVLRTRRLRHATSLIDLAGASPRGRESAEAGRWEGSCNAVAAMAGVPGEDDVVGPRGRQRVGAKGWDGSTRRGRDDPESSNKGAASPAVARP